MRWRQILDEQAKTDGLNIVLMKSDFGLVERDSQLVKADMMIKLGQRVCFELISESNGHAIALQGLRHQWHPIPLGPEGEHVVPINPGQNLLPQTPKGHPDPISENRDQGLREFVIVTTDTADIPMTVRSLITWVSVSIPLVQSHEFGVSLIRFLGRLDACRGHDAAGFGCIV